MDIKNRRCLVTGAGRGLGRQIALDLAKAHAHVHVCDISPEALTPIMADSAGLAVTSHICDVTNEASVKSMFAAIATEGALDVLVNNAGITRDGLLIKSGESGGDRAHERCARYHH